jgi:hypothetical protein
LDLEPDAPPVTADDGFVARLTTDSGIVCVLDTASSIGVDIGRGWRCTAPRAPRCSSGNTC